jgi:hypothetical protein
MAQLGEELRPDRSNLLIRLQQDNKGGLVLQPLSMPKETLTSNHVMSLIGACISNSMPVFISIPTHEGFCHALIELNEVLAEAIAARNLRMARDNIVNAIDFGSTIMTDPIKPL